MKKMISSRQQGIEEPDPWSVKEDGCAGGAVSRFNLRVVRDHTDTKAYSTNSTNSGRTRTLDGCKKVSPM